MTPPALPLALVCALVCAAALGVVLRRLTRRRAPYLAGLALTAATALPVAVLCHTDLCGTLLCHADRRVAAILLASAAVAVVGLIHDVGHLSLATRLIVQSFAAGGVVLCGIQVTLTGDWPDGPVTVMWLVGAANAFALLDRVEGAPAPVAVVTAAFLSAAAVVLDDPGLVAPLAGLGCACLGFLPRGPRRAGRLRRARPWLGASGALFAGFALACGATAMTAGRDAATIAAGLLLPVLVALVAAGACALTSLLRGTRRGTGLRTGLRTRRGPAAIPPRIGARRS
ncbi:hypothetical protein JOL79_18075 [Microbispora sp. RL4-1S]|uniref:Uncharacterized protein n=1 Tax=Microbispora oryzae TaxID=2806554 RepID=A0A940WRH0_9ACTN|nr:hypothetical protein [Microbispora oryzae]MBP2705726.1 hypothetical protein [Microbispora oryzae]